MSSFKLTFCLKCNAFKERNIGQVKTVLFFQEMDEERQVRAEHEFMIQRLTLQVEELQSKLQNKDFKSENYDKVLW